MKTPIQIQHHIKDRASIEEDYLEALQHNADPVSFLRSRYTQEILGLLDHLTRTDSPIPSEERRIAFISIPREYTGHLSPADMMAYRLIPVIDYLISGQIDSGTEAHIFHDLLGIREADFDDVLKRYYPENESLIDRDKLLRVFTQIRNGSKTRIELMA